jgi:uncharacterized membrane protein YjgN (DUF898 family)
MPDVLPSDYSSPEPAPGRQPLQFAYVPRSGLLSLTLTNALLNLITLGIYRFWAKTAVRRHIWSCVQINGEPLEYIGRGIELFKGALIVFLVLVLPAIAAITGIQIAWGPEHPAVFIVQFAFFMLIFVLWGMAVYRARRYQLSRTLWRGIRGALIGSSWSYTWLNVAAQLLKGITLGWSTPAMNLNLQERMIGDMRFGEAPFRFRGPAGPLYRTYAVCWFLTIFLVIGVLAGIGFEINYLFGDNLDRALEQIFRPDDQPRNPDPWFIIAIIAAVFALYILLGLIYSVVWAIYTAREMAVFANYTTFDGARFQLDATALSLVTLAIGNLMILILTLGAGNPFVQQRNVRYVISRMSAEGTVDIGRIEQSRHRLEGYGEGLADAFDIGGL